MPILSKTRKEAKIKKKRIDVFVPLHNASYLQKSRHVGHSLYRESISSNGTKPSMSRETFDIVRARQGDQKLLWC